MTVWFVFFSSGTGDAVRGRNEWSHQPPGHHTVALLPSGIQGERSPTVWEQFSSFTSFTDFCLIFFPKIDIVCPLQPTTTKKKCKLTEKQ